MSRGFSGARGAFSSCVFATDAISTLPSFLKKAPNFNLLPYTCAQHEARLVTNWPARVSHQVHDDASGVIASTALTT